MLTLVNKFFTNKSSYCRNALNHTRSQNACKFFSTYLKNIKSTSNKYFFIHPNSTIDDLKYKEELFEYFAYNYLKMDISELKTILSKMKNFYILDNELRDFKCFLRDFFELFNSPDRDKFEDEEIISEFSKFVTSKLDQVKEYLEEGNFVENNIYDKDFTVILNNFKSFIEGKMYLIRSNENMVPLFEYLDNFPVADNKSSNEIWRKLIECYKTNDNIHSPNNTNFYTNILLLKLVLRAFEEDKISDIISIRYFLNNFILKIADIKNLNISPEVEVENISKKLSSYINSENLQIENNVQKKKIDLLKEFKEVYSIIYSITKKENVANEKNHDNDVEDHKDFKDFKELSLLQNIASKFLLNNNINTKKIELVKDTEIQKSKEFKTKSLKSKMNGNTKAEGENSEEKYEENLKILENVKTKYNI